MNVLFPTSKILTDSLLEALAQAGKPLSSLVIVDEIIKSLNLTGEVVSKIRQGNRTELKYRLAWCRTKAKQNGVIERTSSNKWQLKSLNN
jgi:hypothetical protein